ncbi:hypothetical protein DGG96_14460 [Legionella qingyii]|uniref:Uncharacterized protein n=1 Tax=Legionella qingyii TaxID=2184757 RepID=A0A317TZE8_9GAMM|nr:hypothetical protein [Legionella qingyii]PWY54931.1 hypothetical protein DGG96_14460 [Legionella qingyii]
MTISTKGLITSTLFADGDVFFHYGVGTDLLILGFGPINGVIRSVNHYLQTLITIWLIWDSVHGERVLGEVR